ncbi:MAG: K(+)-transporting ATPase subunit F [Phycisphaerales bacterium]|nr:K(+)-transporting ATPase subunit F [Phycisphaerales bacterium]
MTPQTIIYALAAIIAAALLVYLLVALLKPEWFQ